MTKDEIAAVLEEIGTLLELEGENPFKTRAYQNGARSLEALAGEGLARVRRRGPLPDPRDPEAAPPWRLAFLPPCKPWRSPARQKARGSLKS
jgi:hypothetical protein